MTILGVGIHSENQGMVSVIPRPQPLASKCVPHKTTSPLLTWQEEKGYEKEEKMTIPT